VVLQVLPHSLIAPATGVLNDRLSRKAVMIGADIGRFFVVLGMMAIRTPGMVWLVYPLLLLETIGAAFNEPAHSASIPNIVPEGDVLAANTVASITWSFCLSMGSALGGLTAVLLGRDAVFLLNAASFLVSAWLIRRMDFHEPHMAGIERLRFRELFDFSPVMEGLRYIRSDRKLLISVFVKGGIGLIGANNVLLPILGQRAFPVKLGGLDDARAATLGMSLLMGARGAGSLIGPLVSGRWARDRQPQIRIAIFFGFIVAAAGYVIVGTAVSPALAILAVVLAHSGSSTNWVFSTTLLQIYSADRFRGRVFAADYGLCMLGISASSYAAGVAIDLGFSPRALAAAMGFIMLLPAAAWAIGLRWAKSDLPDRHADDGGDRGIGFQ
jgi:MFS family permease